MQGWRIEWRMHPASQCTLYKLLLLTVRLAHNLMSLLQIDGKDEVSGGPILWLTAVVFLDAIPYDILTM